VAKCKVIIFGDHHEDTLTSMHSLALTYEAQGRAKDALTTNDEVFVLSNAVVDSGESDSHFPISAPWPRVVQSTWLPSDSTIENPLRVQKECTRYGLHARYS
jgi:hypothetical protein